jgi:hypothetical protein
MQVEVHATCGLFELRSGFSQLPRSPAGGGQKPFEELAAILWIHKRSAGSFRKFQKQLILDSTGLT